MLKHITKTSDNHQGVQRSAPSFIPLVSAGPMNVSPLYAAEILEKTDFAGQRKTSAKWVSKFAEMMRRNSWLDHSQIAFCHLGDRWYMVNGKHRLHATIEANRSILFDFVVYDCQTMREVETIYTRFDTELRKRSAEQIVSAFDLADKLGITRGAARAVFSAAKYLQTGLAAPTHYKDLLLVEPTLDIAMQWRREAQIYDELLNGSESGLRKRLLNAGTMAVAMITLRHQPERAFSFWSGVANNDGLRKGDPRHTLITALLGRGAQENVDASVLLPMVAWNAWYAGRTISFLRIANNPRVELLGTPVRGKRG